MTNPDVFDIDAFIQKHQLGDVSEKYRTGIQYQHALDPNLPETIQGILNDVAPDFGKIIVEYVFADIYARPGLDMKYRIIATLAAVTALNQVFAVKEYIRFALNAGFSRTEVVEVLMQMSVYAGMGPAMDALVAARDVFAELDTVGGVAPGGDR
ncbi:4-carboxymuconolactone decarboxylase [Actimicrobium sp. GrIS 1.19]|uniref:carboxymuconolactone decarboxylase family protein n=1 Tax=Actimicrobium sp. GrIS 1.19 TaxID=3071708 RepID=UPI002E08E18A|nr:4-carboxymuconolactone decarboxylase [Actimicrobium sp. GrIS 1.19]